MSNPPPIPAATAPAPRRGRGWKILGILVTLLLLASVAANVIMLVMVIVISAAAGASSERPEARVQAEIVHSGGRDKIAVMPVTGTVDEGMFDQLHNYCEFVKADASIKAVVLQVDSPGGTVNASDEIYHQFLELKSPDRKLVVSMRSMAASGGYYLSMAADRIYAEPTTLTGSIGVIWPAFEITGMMKKVGVNADFVKSDAAEEFKDAGSPFKPFTEEDRAYIKDLVNDAHEKFAAVVEAGRKGRLTVPIAKVAIGKIWTADEAKKLGIIDDIAYLDEVCDRTAADAGLSDPTIIRLKPRGGLLGVLSASAPFGPPRVEVKLDASSLEDLTRGAMEYRYRGIR